MVVPIDSTFEKKVRCVDALESQFYEWNPWLAGYLDEVPQGKAERLEWTRKRWAGRSSQVADKYRDMLIEELGVAEGKAVKSAEAFELCEYGSRPTKAELRTLFPFFGGE